jgi:competence protein ComEC
MIRMAAWMLAGNLLVLQYSVLPRADMLWLALPAALALALLRCRGGALAVLAIGWTAFAAHQALAQRLDHAHAGADYTISGRVADFPRHGQIRSSFDFAVHEAPAEVPDRLRLSWYRAPRQVQPGEALILTVRLRPPRGLANPGGGDYEARMFRARVGATGYVRSEQAAAGAVPPRLWLLEWRTALAGRASQTLGEGRPVAILLALGLGTRHLLDGDTREVLARTGTSHLMAISGLHVGLVAALGLAAGRAVWAHLPGPPRRLQPLLAGAWLGLLLAAGYALMAGFAIPTRRALVMLVVVLAALCLRRPLRPGRALALAAMLVLAIDPLATLDVSFWLSFLAVAVIAFSLHGRLAPPRGEDDADAALQRWRRRLVLFVGLQAWIVIGMAPATGVFFGQVPLVSPLANALLVPLFSLLVVPGTLLGMLLLVPLPALAVPLLAALAWLLEALWPALEWLASWRWAVVSLPSLPAGWWLVLCVAALLILLPRGMPGRWLAVPLCAAALAWRAPAPAPGEFQVWLIDVGQGLSVLVRTHRHALLYDAGPAYAEGLDTGATAVVPLLAHQGIRRLDVVVISHADNDHAGGLPAVQAAMPVERLLVGGAASARLDGAPCIVGQQWDWDGVRFEMLYPVSLCLAGNEGSCVLSVRAAGGSLLLTGDIEFWGESTLLAGDSPLHHRLVQVPHHGSRSSSSAALVAAVRPEFALVGAGHANQYGFPRAEVVARWQGVGAQVLNTGEIGAVEITVPVSGEILVRPGWRERRRRLWHGQ